MASWPDPPGIRVKTVGSGGYCYRALTACIRIGKAMALILGDVTAVLMAKLPEAGTANTRLVRSGGLTAEEAVRVGWAMLRCTAQRLCAASSQVILAASPDGCGAELAEMLDASFAQVVDQGTGDLGRRMECVWEAVGAQRVAFFGADTPDVPVAALRAIPEALANHDLAVGPTPDGGYWTLCAGAFHPKVLREIDWGTARVYHQTLENAAQAGLEAFQLPHWYDVDEPDDLLALGRRLVSRNESSLTETVDEFALRTLAEQIRTVTDSLTPPETSV